MLTPPSRGNPGSATGQVTITTFRNFAQSFIGCLELGRSLTIIELMEKFASQDQAFQAPTLFPPAYVVCGKVMFSVVSLCSRRASGPHVTYIKICSLPPSHATPEPVQICSLGDPPGPVGKWAVGFERPSISSKFYSSTGNSNDFKSWIEFCFPDS